MISTALINKRSSGSKITVLVVLSLLFSLSLSAQYVISGIVIDKHTKAPIVGANITLNKAQGVASDEHGGFGFETTVSEVVLKITSMGYESYKQTITLQRGDNRVAVELAPAVYTSEEVVIAARGFKTKELLMPIRIQKISQSQIAAIPAQKIVSVLQYAAGVDVDNALGIFSDRSVVSMRGMGGDNQGRMLVLLDGAPLNKADGGSVNWNAINAQSVDNIEIIRGPASTIYGANAMGGVIKVTSKHPDSLMEAQAALQYGTYHTMLADFHIAQSRIDTLQRGAFWSANIHGGRSDGYIVEAEEYLEYGEDTLLRPSYFKELSLDAVAGYQFSASKKLALSVNGFTNKRGGGWQVFDEEGSYSKRQDINTRINWHSTIGASVFWESSPYFRIEEYYTQNEYLNSYGDFSLYEVVSDRVDAGWLNTIKKQIGVTILTGGIDFRYGGVDAADIYFTSTDSIVNKGQMIIGAVFLQDKIQLFEERVSITAGVRFDYAGFFGGSFQTYYPSKKINYLFHFQDSVMPNTSWNAVTPRLSFLYSNQKNIRIYAGFSTGFRPPTLDDMCRSESQGNRFRQANPALKDETLSNIEVGGDVGLGKTTILSISAYYSIGQDFMYEVSTGDSVDMGYKIVPIYKMDNISKMEAYGYEVSLKSQIWKGISCFGNYAYTHSSILSFEMKNPEVDFDLTGKELANVPNHIASAGVSWDNPIISFSLLIRYKGERYINDRNITDYKYFMSPKYPAYTTLNASIWKVLPFGLKATLNMENLTDDQFLDSKGRVCPGRMIMGKLSWTFSQ